MSDAPVDPRWPKILSLSVHEFRTPMTVVAGYIRMLLKDRAGPLSDQQRQLLEEAEKSCARLTALLAEVSELSNLEGGHGAVQQADRPTCTRRCATPWISFRRCRIARSPIDAAARRRRPRRLTRDPVRLTQAFSSMLKSLRREIISDDAPRRAPAATARRLRDPDRRRRDARRARRRGRRRAELFDEWRGGSGLILPVARRIIEAHGGRHLGRAGRP